MCKTPPPRTALPRADRPRLLLHRGSLSVRYSWTLRPVLLDTPGLLDTTLGVLDTQSGTLGHFAPGDPWEAHSGQTGKKSGSPGHKIGSLGHNFWESGTQKLGVLDTISGSLGHSTPFNSLSIRYLQNPLTFLIFLTFLLEWRGVYFGYPPPLLFCRKGDLQTPIQSSRCVPGYRLLL